MTEVALMAVACVLTVLAYNGRWWNERPVLCGDNAKHYTTARCMLGSLREASGWSDALRAVLHPWTEYPPLTYAWTCTVFGGWRATEDTATLGQIAWVVMMFVAISLFMRRHVGPALALATTLLATTSPVVVNASMHFAPDIALASTTFVALALLAADPRFTSRTLAISLGVATGCSLLAKWTALLYLPVPLALATLLALRAASPRGRWRFLLLLAVLVNVVLAIPLGVAHDAVQAQLWAVATAIPLALVALRLLDGDGQHALGNLFLALIAAWVLTAGVYAQLAPRLVSRVSLAVSEGVPLQQQIRVFRLVATGGIVGLPVLVPIGLGMLARRRGAGPFRWIGLAFVSGLVLTAVAQVPPPRYYAPLVPLAAVLATWWVPSLPSRPRLWVGTVLVAASLAQAALLGAGELAPLTSPRWMATWLETWHELDHAETMDIGPQPLLRARMDAALETLRDFGGRAPMATLVIEEGREGPPASAWEALSLDSRSPLIVQQLGLREGEVRIEARPWNLRALSQHPGREAGDQGPTGYPADVVLLVGAPDKLGAMEERVENATGRHYSTRTVLSWPEGAQLQIMRP